MKNSILTQGSMTCGKEEKTVFTHSEIEAPDLEAFYIQVSQQVEHLIAGERNEFANLSNVSALLNMHLQDINWVGFYLWYEAEQELVLGPFQGKPACIRIGMGRGVCGEAVKDKRTLVVEDVLSFPGHIACDALSRSEIVVPLLRGTQVMGVLDIDSPNRGRFGPQDAQGLQRIAAIVAQGTAFAHAGE
ncbi:GAF domain-containing protein [Alicyclobacillus tolerans]|nr:GAF domain-containing protein [Alicyclobacillus tolerans]MCF8565357.1 GAF domain-containing protein [Alicyclobacillus tolerans]